MLVLGSMALGAFVWLFAKGQIPRRDETPPGSDQFYSATSAYRAGKYGDAYGIMYPLAKAGDANAQFNLAFMYAWGRGVPNDRGKVLNDRDADHHAPVLRLQLSPIDEQTGHDHGAGD